MGMIAETFGRVALGQGLAPQTLASACRAGPGPARRARAAPSHRAALAAPMQGGPLALAAARGLFDLFRGTRA